MGRGVREKEEGVVVVDVDVDGGGGGVAVEEVEEGEVSLCCCCCSGVVPFVAAVCVEPFVCAAAFPFTTAAEGV